MGRLYNLGERLKERLVSALGDPEEADKLAEGTVMYKDGYLTSAQILALNTTPIEAIPAPGSGKCLIVTGMYGTIDYNSATYNEGTGVLRLSYTDASGDIASQFTNAFLEASADATAYAEPVIECVPVANAALVFNTAADPTTGDSLIYYRIWYRIVPSLLSA